MKRFSEQFHKQSKSVTLQAVEREALKERVLSYMEYHPLPAHLQAVETKPSEVIPSPYEAIRFPSLSIPRWSLGVAVFLMAIVPVIADRSNPGDSLYAVKVRFNEEVISTLTLNPYKKIEWETERLNRRIAEARLLASEGKLTSEVEAEIAEAVREQTDSVQEEIAGLRESDADQAALATIELNTTLAMQSSALQADGETTLAMALADVSSDTQAQTLVDVINESLLEQQGIEVTNIPAYDKIMARIEENTTRAYELLSSLRLDEENELKGDIGRRLEDIGRSIEAANSLRTSNEDQAREQLVDVLQRTQKLIVFMTAVDVGTVGGLNAAVPVVLTEEEQRLHLTETEKEINRIVEILSIVRPQMSLELEGKVDYAVGIAEANQASIASSTEVSSAARLADESLLILQDTIKLVESEGIKVSGAAILPTEAATEGATTTEAELKTEESVEL